VDAPLVIEEYADFQCPFCAQFATGVLPQIEDAYMRANPGKVRFIFRHIAVLGPDSQAAAEASECANEQGKFWDYADLLYTNQRQAGAFGLSRLKEYAGQLGLDTSAFGACVDTRRYREVVEQETQRGRERGVRYTPTFIVNGQTLVGAVEFSQLSQIIDPATH
jgi:protein-disulfide isomerase